MSAAHNAPHNDAHNAPRNDTTSEVHVWFLRGINVGGAHSLRMAALRDHLSALGAEDVKTYIQSGNVVFRASPQLASALPGLFEDEAPGRYGFFVPVVARTAAELAAIVTGNPFLRGQAAGAEIDHKQYHLGLLLKPPEGPVLSEIGPEDYQPDDYAVQGRDIYFYLPAGVAESKLLKWKGFAKLWGGMTLRNWRTVLTTLALAS